MRGSAYRFLFFSLQSDMMTGSWSSGSFGVLQISEQMVQNCSKRLRLIRPANQLWSVTSRRRRFRQWIRRVSIVPNDPCGQVRQWHRTWQGVQGGVMIVLLLKLSNWQPLEQICSFFLFDLHCLFQNFYWSRKVHFSLHYKVKHCSNSSRNVNLSFQFLIFYLILIFLLILTVAN